MIDKYSSKLIEKARKIKLLALDVDGVLTDGRIIYGNSGEEIKNFDVNDGFGITLIRRSGIKCVILTAQGAPLVKKRARELKIDKVYQNFHYKIEAFAKIKNKFKVEEDEICFAGDDLVDIPVLKRVGLAVCPRNAMEEVKAFAHYVTEKPGGAGAVREICNFILKAQGTWEKVTSRYFE
ncbi:MAG: HAD-IIIA family hydrolase [Candidatus Omnitrophota bacterium]|nr:HAD-IIIA family hydrolase [Candidatus Omnitrophota bacterium]